MFTLDTRISDALAERPELLEILPAFHPAFEKLKHPVLGRIMPKLVDVAGAARVAGVDPEALLAVMNLPGAAHPAPSPAPRSDQPPPPWLSGARVRQLDARPTIASGGEPFGAIMEALRGLAPGEVLTVLVPFEPAPLLDLLGRQGWQHHVRWDGETCCASFWFPPDRRPATGSEGAAAQPERDGEGWRLDVSGLEPPQPLRAVLAALDRGELPLTVRHRREPALLYPRLEERGLRWRVSGEPGDFLIHIERGD